MPSYEYNPVDLAWCVGFFDGEGCFHLAHGKHATMKVGQRNQEVITKFASIVQIGQTSALLNNGKPWFEWRAQGRDVEFVFNLLKSYLGTIKIEDAQFVLGYAVFKVKYTTDEERRLAHVESAARYREQHPTANAEASARYRASHLEERRLHDNSGAKKSEARRKASVELDELRKIKLAARA